MASFGKKIYHQDENTSQSGGPLPEGVYGLEITESDYGDVGQGKQAKFTATVLAPAEYEGRTLWINEWHEHPNEQSQRIGNANIAKLARACGLDDGYEATEDFHSKPFVARVGFGKPYQSKKDGVPQYNDDGTPVMRRNNEVKRYYYPEEDAPDPHVASDELPPIPTGAPANDNRAAANDNRPAARPAAAAAGGTKDRPWARGK